MDTLTTGTHTLAAGVGTLTAGVVGALVGALVAYILGWSQKLYDDRRRRRSVATGLLIEVYWITDALAHLQQAWGRTKAIVAFPTRVHEQFSGHLDYFRPSTIYKVLDFFGSLRDIEQALSVIRNREATNLDQVRADVQLLARVGIRKALSASRALRREGGAIPEDTALPPETAVAAFLEEVKRPWKIEGRGSDVGTA